MSGQRKSAIVLALGCTVLFVLGWLGFAGVLRVPANPINAITHSPSSNAGGPDARDTPATDQPGDGSDAPVQPPRGEELPQWRYDDGDGSGEHHEREHHRREHHESPDDDDDE